MNDPQTAAKRKLSQILVAALTVQPLDPGLSEDELKTAALRFGISPALFDEVLHEFWADHSDRSLPDVIMPASLDLTRMVMFHNGYPSAIPMRAVERLGQAFTQLEKRHGTRSAKTPEMLVSECGGPEHDTKVALGFLLALGHAERVSGGFRRSRFSSGSFGRNDPAHPDTEALSKAAAIVATIFAARQGSVSQQAPPIERFHSFLNKQGWHVLASWWALTSRELSAISDHYPTSATVLAGALLEAALTAISDLARDGGHWRQKFLSERTPEQWTLSKLIDQAAEAGTFDVADKLMAQKLADFRNRIHAGRYHTGGRGPFTPRSVDGQEAHLAKLHLEHLLKRILDWKPIAELA